MIKIKFIYPFFLLLFFLNGCGFKPTLIGSDYDFKIKIGTNTGNKQINTKIENKIRAVDGIKRTFIINFSSKETKNVLSKDSKGDPLIFELVIDVKYIVEKNGTTIIENNLARKATYNNIVEKFELESYEKTIIDNLSSNIADRIIFAISEMN